MAGALQNGRLPSSALAAIPGGRLRPDAARAWIDLRQEIIRRGGPAIAPKGSVSSYRDLPAQQVQRNYWCGKGLCKKAAVPGTSNHGWGLAVDVMTVDESWMRQFGPKFGWSHDEGARVGESWHFRYVGGYVPAPDPTRVLTTTERGWITELQATKDPRRRRELQRKIAVQMKVIARAARAGGWNVKNRRARYDFLRRYA